MCFKKPDPPPPTAPLPPIEAPTFVMNDEARAKSKGKGLKIGTKQLQVPLGGTQDKKSGLGISASK